MAEVYSDDLRRKLLEAYRDGEGSLPQLAQRFRVSVGWAKKISAALLHTGEMERPAGRQRGRQSKATGEVLEYLRALVAAQPDLTLEKLQEALERDRQVHLSIGRMWLVLKRMGLRLKKSHSMPRSGRPGGSEQKDNSGRKKPNRSIRHGSSSSTRVESPPK